MAHEIPTPGLRPFLPSDTPIVAAIMVASIEGLAADDYSENQRAAWASAADDEEALQRRLAGQLTLVATIDGVPVGFASLKGVASIDMLYMHPAFAGNGIGAALADALEKLAAGRGARALTVDASDSAQGFFTRRGYIAEQRNTVVRAGEWLGNTTMRKTLAPEGGTR